MLNDTTTINRETGYSEAVKWTQMKSERGGKRTDKVRDEQFRRKQGGKVLVSPQEVGNTHKTKSEGSDTITH